MWKNGFHEKSQNTLEFMGAPGASCAFMGAHWCSSVFAWLFGCLVVCLFDCLIVWLFLKPHPFFDLEKMGLKWRSLSDCSALDGIGNKPQAGEHQEKRILWNLCERWAAIIFINKNHRLDGVSFTCKNKWWAKTYLTKCSARIGCRKNPGHKTGGFA